VSRDPQASKAEDPRLDHRLPLATRRGRKTWESGGSGVDDKSVFAGAARPTRREKYVPGQVRDMEVGRRDHAKSGDSVAVARAVPVDVDAIALPKVVDVMEGAVSVEARYGCDVVAGDSDGRSQ